MTKQKHAGGRPPAGVRPGERVSDYAHFTIRLPHDVRALLHAVGEVTHAPGWRVLHDALHAYVRTLSAPDQQLVSTLTKRRIVAQIVEKRRGASRRGRKGE